MHLVIAGTVATFWSWGLMWWTPTFLVRSHGLTVGQAGNLLGPMHLIAAAGCPSVVLFSQASDPALCAPRGRSVTVLRKPDLSALSLEDVLRALPLAEPPCPAPAGETPRSVPPASASGISPEAPATHAPHRLPNAAG